MVSGLSYGNSFCLLVSVMKCFLLIDNNEYSFISVYDLWIPVYRIKISIVFIHCHYLCLTFISLLCLVHYMHFYLKNKQTKNTLSHFSQDHINAQTLCLHLKIVGTSFKLNLLSPLNTVNNIFEYSSHRC